MRFFEILELSWTADPAAAMDGADEESCAVDDDYMPQTEQPAEPVAPEPSAAMVAPTPGGTDMMPPPPLPAKYQALKPAEREKIEKRISELKRPGHN